ncbi:hypothetical protein TBR22_A06050 [Luteitalea sp. TBR-22]|uniref:hypothetical protein n=1 Tax=Luteitalea sp. TBR-22 TaxID=2802971 RepID=UPI001AFBC025|nr:hypothetical protein [Luteitalea sp. TBR-22]BCS31404.1 hypothetical protein TBR22_A06050 [Luteitalea sp. TBR-22]
MPSLSIISIFIFVGVLLISVVVWHVRTALSLHVPTATEWAGISERITSLSKDVVDVSDYSENARRALDLVLTNEPGYGRLAAIPQAMELLIEPVEAAARLLRTASSQVVMIGLLGTVLIFAITFQSADVSDPAALLTHLKFIYWVNAVGLFVSVLLLLASMRARAAGEHAVRIAGKALHLLQDSGSSNLAPELVKALEVSASQFQQFSQQLFNDQFAKIQTLLGSVQGVGTSLHALVDQVVVKAADERTAFEATSRQHVVAIEALTQRLDQGFQLLATPFLEGIPAMHGLTQAAQALQKSSDDVMKANVAQAVAQLKVATQGLNRILEGLPQQVAQATSEANAAVRESTVNAVQAALENAITPLSGRIEESGNQLTTHLRGLLTSWAKFMDEQRRARLAGDEQMTQSLSKISGALRTDMANVASVLETLNESARLLPGAVRHQMDAGAQRIEQHLAGLAGGIGNVGKDLSALPTAVAGEVQRSTGAVARELADVSATLRQLDEHVRQIPGALAPRADELTVAMNRLLGAFHEALGRGATMNEPLPTGEAPQADVDTRPEPIAPVVS